MCAAFRLDPASVVVVMMMVVVVMMVMVAPVAPPMVVVMMVVRRRRVVLGLDQPRPRLFLGVGEAEALDGVRDRVEQLGVGLRLWHGGGR